MCVCVCVQCAVQGRSAQKIVSDSCHCVGLMTCVTQVIGPLEHDELFILEDFALLERHTFKTSGAKIKNKVTPMKLDDRE